MDILLYFLIAGFVMALFSIPVIAMYAALETKAREKEIKHFVRKQLIEQLRNEEEMEARNKRISQQ